MRTNFVRLGLFVVLAGALSACATSPTPPPEPNMEQLVPVNSSWPPPALSGSTAKAKPIATTTKHAKDKKRGQGNAR